MWMTSGRLAVMLIAWSVTTPPLLVFLCSIVVLSVIASVVEMRPSLSDRILGCVGMAAAVCLFVAMGWHPLAVATIYVVVARELEISKDTQKSH
jgi:hypothetical protein